MTTPVTGHWTLPPAIDRQHCVGRRSGSRCSGVARWMGSALVDRRLWWPARCSRCRERAVGRAAAVLATSNELGQLDPAAANPDGLATRAAEELEKTRLAEHPRMGQAKPPPDQGQPRHRPRSRPSRRVWMMLAGAGVALTLLVVVIVANVNQDTGSVIFEDDFPVRQMDGQ